MGGADDGPFGARILDAAQQKLTEWHRASRPRAYSRSEAAPVSRLNRSFNDLAFIGCMRVLYTLELCWQA
jgi:hypothetical protein